MDEDRMTLYLLIITVISIVSFQYMIWDLFHNGVVLVLSSFGFLSIILYTLEAIYLKFDEYVREIDNLRLKIREMEG